ncbi:MAG TPA: thiamine phosphate synthase [Candidatus Limnocylindrales bacterium]|jgi:thiamine-phosphate pyrophosphorylase
MTGPIASERIRRRELLRRAGVYLVTEESLSVGRRSERIVEAALESGVRVIQVREKDGSARRALEIALAVRRLTRRYDALLIVNDRIDVAIAAEADGVHLGQADLPVATARRLLGEAALIGLSITDAAQMGAPDAVLADCLGVGAVFPTGSKTDATLTGLPLLAAIRAVEATSGAPIVAIGGIDAENAGAAIRAGADLVAVISAVTAAPDPGRAAAELLAAVRTASATPTGSPR